MRLLILTQKVDREDPILGFFHRWLEEFARSVDFVTVICLERGKVSLPKNVKVFSLGKEKKTWRIVRLFRFYKYILAERNNYDAVFVHMNPEYVILGGLIWTLLRKRISLWYMHKAVNWRLRGALALTDLVFTGSAQSFRIASPKVHVLGHGIDTEYFKPAEKKSVETPPERQFRVLSVSRIAPVKDIMTLVRAIQGLRGKATLPVTLMVVGLPVTEADKEYFAMLKEYIGKEDLKQLVRFVGGVGYQDIVKYYQAADVFVNTSQTGSLDKTVLEAMACNTPVLTSNESFKGVLDDTYFFPQGGYRELAGKIELLALGDNGQSSGNHLRGSIERDHSVVRLIPRIVQLLS